MAARSSVTCFVPGWVELGDIMKRIRVLILTRARNDLEHQPIGALWAARGGSGGSMRRFLLQTISLTIMI